MLFTFGSHLAIRFAYLAKIHCVLYIVLSVWLYKLG